jgi:hypothetical protein
MASDLSVDDGDVAAGADGVLVLQDGERGRRL